VRDGLFYSHGCGDNALSEADHLIRSAAIADVEPVTIELSTGDANKNLLRRPENSERFESVSIGFNAAALVVDVHQCVSEGQHVIIKEGTHLLALTADELKEADDEIVQKATEGGLVSKEESAMDLPEEVLPFQKVSHHKDKKNEGSA
jgi:hypothetical protein